MISATPGNAERREWSTRPSFPTTPTAVRCATGIGRASYPSSPMTSTTRSTSAAEAPCCITTSMSDRQRRGRLFGVERARDRILDRSTAHVHADQRRDTRLLHGHAINGIRCFGSRAWIVRDHDELRVRLELVQHLHEATDVRVVERGIDFVQ